MKLPESLRITVGPALLASVFSTSAFAQISTLPPTVSRLPTTATSATIRQSKDVINNLIVPRAGGSQLTLAPTLPPVHLGTFDISIIPGPGLAGNAPALAAFNRAAASWEARITDPITVNINADLGGLGVGILGSTSVVALNAAYGVVRDQIVLDGADEPSNGITAFLPTPAQFGAFLPGPITAPGPPAHAQDFLSGDIVATKANLKALGFTGLDPVFGDSDAEITFSNTFAFDFDNSDGVGAGLIDFETVAAHEIGHALGFISIVDSLNDANQHLVDIPPLDLFRFGNGSAFDPTTSAEFTTFPRNFVPGVQAITDEINGATPEQLMSTGTLDLSFNYPGRDGNQASHWKADEQTGNLVGLMDPTLGFGQFYGPKDPDFRALDLIGYDILVVPEPTGVCAVLGLTALIAHRLYRTRKS